MKTITKKLSYFLLCFALSVSSLFAQAPKKMSYQAVIRNSNNVLVASTNVGMRISVLQGSSSGTAVFVETHSATTNVNGLVSVEIGGGTAVTGTFSAINWANGPYFVKTETDPAGGTSYSITGTQQLLSVPYALYADSSRTAGPQGPAGIAGPQGPQGPAGPQGPGFTHYIGELFGGGIVFHVYKDANGDEHGLIATLTNLSTGIDWWSGAGVLTSVNNFWDGETNTSTLVGISGSTGSAAALCANSTSGGQSDWYLPAPDQLVLLRNVKYDLNRVLSSLSGANQIEATNAYWSSAELSQFQAYWVDMRTGEIASWSKSDGYPVRGVRNF